MGNWLSQEHLEILCSKLRYNYFNKGSFKCSRSLIISSGREHKFAHNRKRRTVGRVPRPASSRYDKNNEQLKRHGKGISSVLKEKWKPRQYFSSGFEIQMI